MAIRDGQTTSPEENRQSSLNDQEIKPPFKWAIDELNEDEAYWEEIRKAVEDMDKIQPYLREWRK